MVFMKVKIEINYIQANVGWHMPDRTLCETTIFENKLGTRLPRIEDTIKKVLLKATNDYESQSNNA